MSIDAAVRVLLQHASFGTDLELVCRLLQANKEMAAAVAEHSLGRLALGTSVCSPAPPWLCKHGQLLGLLRVTRPAVATAVMEADPQRLTMLRVLHLCSAVDATLSLLQQVPGSHLTDLKVYLVARAAPRLSPALARLTALRSLRVCPSTMEPPFPELSGLSALVHLTSLDWSWHASSLQHVPIQLLEMTFGPHGDGDVLDVSRLTHLTSLVIRSCRGRRPLLPPGLQRLCLWALTSQSDPDLAAFTSLTSLHLSYSLDSHVVPASAATWPALPALRSMELEGATLAAPTCRLLARLGCLTSLHLFKWRSQAGMLPTALRHLSALRRLRLTGGQDSRDDSSQLVFAVGSLRNLCDLRISFFPRLAAAAGVAGATCLTGLTALTQLSLAGCCLTDACLAAIVAQLPRLQDLDCSTNSCLTVAALPALQQLAQLTRLCWDGAGLRGLAGGVVVDK